MKKNLGEILKHKDVNEFPVLYRYLNYQNNIKNEKENLYSLDNLHLFNTVLNLFIEKYSHKISRDFAEKTVLKDDEIYLNDQENRILIDKFINYFNKLQKNDNRDNKNKILQLSNENKLCDFILDDTEIGKIYKKIYEQFAKEQNNKIGRLLEIKIN